MIKMFFYKSITNEFDSIVNMNDTDKRISVVFEEPLNFDIKGLTLLDVGCGAGWFSKRSSELGDFVSSLDMGIGLINQVRLKCESYVVVGGALKLHFKSNSIDIVVCSEVIEHISDSTNAINELCRVIKPSDTRALTTPNQKRYFALVIANFLRIKKYRDLENWSSWKSIDYPIAENGFRFTKKMGIRILPFYPKQIYPFLEYLEKLRTIIPTNMVNIGICARKTKND
jgi:2-polyprenyl-3-methyl-5-hydroxy-6-metoxy-1,4-benzoquinol methylase